MPKKTAPFKHLNKLVKKNAKKKTGSPSKRQGIMKKGPKRKKVARKSGKLH